MAACWRILSATLHSQTPTSVAAGLPVTLMEPPFLPLFPANVFFFSFSKKFLLYSFLSFPFCHHRGLFFSLFHLMLMGVPFILFPPENQAILPKLRSALHPQTFLIFFVWPPTVRKSVGAPTLSGYSLSFASSLTICPFFLRRLSVLRCLWSAMVCRWHCAELLGKVK